MGEQYNELSAILRRVRARWRAMTALRAWTRAAVAAAIILLLALMTHRLLAPEGAALVMLWGAAAVVAAAAMLWIVAPLRRSPGDRQVARFVEECCPELEDCLVTAVSEREHESPAADPRDRAVGRAMLAAVVGDALQRARALDLDRIVSRDALRRAGMVAAAATVALFVLGFFSAGPAGRAAGVFALYLFPERLVLEVHPGDVKMRAGQPLRVRARLPEARGAVVPVLRFGDGKAWREVRMDADANGGFSFAFDAVEQGFTYGVSAATAKSRDYRVTVVRPPRVERIDLHYEYPKAFGLKPRVEEDSGDIYGPIGTRVRVLVHSDKPLTAAALTLGAGKRVELRQAGEGASGEMVIAEDGSYRVALADTDGLASSGDTEYFIRTLEDRPPDVRIVRPAGDKQVTPIEEVAVEARADDDFGVATFDLVYSVRGGDEKAVPFTRDGSGMTVNGKRTVYLEDLDVQPGDFVTYYARARDVSRGKRATEARSDIFFLEVKPFEEEFVAAQSQAMGGGSGDRSLDDLAEAQKEIIVATWKLDARGRNTRGQSQDDIRNVGRAQAELQKRAQGAMGQLNRTITDPRRRRSARPAGPQPPAEPSPTDDPMSKAVTAMGKAVVELEALKTAGALPHEMVALNELLRAQAEVRKRQVQRQQNAMGGGRGSNRQQQDLSSLFDRELARQQSTNYETPTSSETREEQNEDESALDKIRELARRQDALNREQQDLAKRREQMTEEELRRELEKLTREQTELRRQAEELSRQMQQRPQQSGRGEQQSRNQRSQSGQGQQNAESGRMLREASEDMQSAASDLRRQDPTQASARGNRALDKLRDVEQRMRSAQPDDRRRALGELQLESRQLADAQRQLANEASTSQSGKPSGSPAAGQPGQQSDDAGRRRAGEQERLADRMQRLEQSVRQLARGAEGARGATDDERKALGDAARDVERQKLSERMRNAARAERAAGEGTRDQRAGAREGQDIAKQVERLAERLGAASGQSAEARRLSEQLARTRELRDRIGEVDRQLSEMRRSGDQGRETPDAGRPQETQRSGQPQEQQGDQRSASSQGQQGQTGQQGPGDGGRGDAQQGREQGRSWQEARELVDDLRREEGLGRWTPENAGFNPGISAPGTQAWKQDFAKWEELKKQMEVALEKSETALASRLREQEAKDRLNAGATQAVPEQYRRLVDKYYRALAQRKR